MKKTVFIGIDVSKGYADFVFIDSNQEKVMDNLQFDDNSSGHDGLGKLLKDYCSLNTETEFLCVVESTGGYERNWCNYLLNLSESLPVKVGMINPVVIKGISKASLDRTVTDEVSAMNIARYIISYKGKIFFNDYSSLRDNPFKTGRSFYTYLRMLIKQKVQLENQLEKLLYQYFPEVLLYCRHGTPAWLLRILRKYPSAESIRKAGTGKLIKLRGIGKDKASKIVEKASLNTGKLSKHMEYILANTSMEILHRDENIKNAKEYLERLYKDNPLVKLLCTITGIGYSSAILILFEIENVNRFENAKKMAAYFGLNPEYKKSGDGTWGNHMSKKGRKMIRAVLYMACLCAIRYDPFFKKRYSALRAKGKSHYSAMGVLMHKMIRTIYGVLKSNTPYNVDIDEKNRQKALENSTDVEELQKKQIRDNLMKKRRLQTQAFSQAPISNRKAKKLKELEMP